MIGPDRLHDLLDAAAASHPDHPAVSHRQHTLTYRELCARSHALARWLRAAGIGRGDRVVVATSVDVLLPAVVYACSRVGAVFAVVRARAPEVVLSHILDDAEPALVVTDAPAVARLADSRGVPHRDLDSLRRAAAEPLPDVTGGEPLAVDPACLIYTSGSTGMPKAVVSTHAQMTFAARAIQSVLEYQADDVVYCALPLSFDYGLYQLFLATLAGARVCLATAEDAGRRLLAQLRETGATVLPAVPPLATNLAALLDRPGATAPPLRLLTNTGAAMPVPVLAALRSRIPSLRVQLMFGLTECKRATIMPKDEDLRRPGACGRALPGTEVFAVDDRGRRLPPGHVGELVVRGPHVMAGYWRRPALTEQRFRMVDGLFPQLHTGDYGWLDADGYLYYVGRRDDLYKERGTRVSTTEVEAAAHRIAGVTAAAAVPPAAGEETATLLVVTDLSATEVLRRLREQLEEEKIPRRCLVIERLPVTDNGKPDRARLAALAGGGA